MIPQQTFESYPVFGDNSTKVKPDDAKYAAGFQQSDVLPAEWMNWAWAKNTKGITDLNRGLDSVEKEINSVLSSFGISPAEAVNNQLLTALRLNASFVTANSTTVTGPLLVNGGTIRVLFTAALTGSNTTTGLSLTYNTQSIAVKVNKNGVKANFVAAEVSTRNYKYLHAYTTLELVYDGVDFLIVGNPIVLSSADYKIHADGSVGEEPIGTLKHFYLNSAPYGYLACDGSTYNTTTYADLYAKLGSNKVPDYRECAIVGVGKNTTNTIGAHEEYTLGQFKDDQVQQHQHYLLQSTKNNALASYLDSRLCAGSGSNSGLIDAPNTTSVVVTARVGDVTRGKRKGALICIKAL
jgi:microcystin-dependent protein